MGVSVLVGVISVVFASSAHAATLVATTDQAIYQQGDLVTVTLTGTTVGAGPGITEPTDLATHIDVRVVGTGFTEVGTDTGRWDACVRETAPPLSNFCLLGNPWAVGGTQGTTVAGNYIAFSQVGIEPATDPVPQLTGMTDVLVPQPIPGPVEGYGVLNAVFTTTAGPQGIYPINMSDIGVGFFSVTGPQPLGSYTVVPNPPRPR